MYLANFRGALKFPRRKPQLLSVAATNLSHQFTHRVVNGKLNGWSHPAEVINAFVTDICNMSCRECHYANSDKPGFNLYMVGHMQPHLFRKFMDEIPGRPMVSFTGGEPLLHPIIFDLITYAKQKGCVSTFRVLSTGGAEFRLEQWGCRLRQPHNLCVMPG